MKKTENPFVFSTGGEVCPGCGRAKAECACLPMQEEKPAQEVIRISRETKGRKGAGVTLVDGLGTKELPELAVLLKKKCGTGGTVRAGVVELQGDKREEAERILGGLGYKTKRCGG